MLRVELVQRMIARSVSRSPLCQSMMLPPCPALHSAQVTTSSSARTELQTLRSVREPWTGAQAHRPFRSGTGLS